MCIGILCFSFDHNYACIYFLILDHVIICLSLLVATKASRFIYWDIDSFYNTSMIDVYASLITVSINAANTAFCALMTCKS